MAKDKIYILTNNGVPEDYNYTLKELCEECNKKGYFMPYTTVHTQIIKRGYFEHRIEVRTPHPVIETSVCLIIKPLPIKNEND